jgi:hypothetical protein
MDEKTLLILILVASVALFLGWFFVRQAKFKERLLLIEKGIEIKELNDKGSKSQNIIWLRIGIIITGTALGALLVALTSFNPGVQEAVILLFTGVSVIAAYFAGSLKG